MLHCKDLYLQYSVLTVKKYSNKISKEILQLSKRIISYCSLHLSECTTLQIYFCPTFSISSLYKKNTSELYSSVRKRREVCFRHFKIFWFLRVCFSCHQNVTWTQIADLSGYAQSILKLSSERWPWNYCPNLINGLEISYPTVRMDH